MIRSKPATTPTPAPAPRVFTIGKLARRWDCTQQHVIDLIDAGQLQAINIGGASKCHWRIPPEAVIAFETAKSSMRIPAKATGRKDRGR